MYDMLCERSNVGHESIKTSAKNFKTQAKSIVYVYVSKECRKKC